MNGIDHLTKKASELAVAEDDEGREKAEGVAANPVLEVPPTAPEIARDGTLVVDVTEEFFGAAQQLGTGELVKDPYFTLFEAVSALEIMDPKMDSGYLAPGDTLEDAYDVRKDLLPEEVIGIIDQLICHEMSWHAGYPLSQTIFTSLYIDRMLEHKPKNIEVTRFDGLAGSYQKETMGHRALRAYCLGLLKTCSYVNNRVKAEHFYEDEDFVTHTYNRTLLDEVPDCSILDFLISTIQMLSSDVYSSCTAWKAVLDRLRFRRAFLETVAEACSNAKNASAIKALWDQLIETLPPVKSSTCLGKPVLESFSVKIQRKLASTLPPRPIVQTSFEDAFANLEQLCRDGQGSVEVLTYYDSHSLMTFVVLFQARKPQSHVFIRTLLQSYLFGENRILGRYSIRDLLDDDLASVVLPADQLLDRSNDEVEVPTDPRHQMAQKMEVFRMRAAQSYLDILRCLCQNRCRIRRSLCHTIVDWDNLQLDGEELDQQLREWTKEKPVSDGAHGFLYAFPLSSWAYFHKLRQMEWIVQMGFELEIYQPDELASMYWYLDFLSSTRIDHIERIRGFVLRSFAALGCAKHGTSPQTDRDYGKCLAFLDTSMLEATAIQAFANALTCLYTSLTRLSLISRPSRPYSNDAQRYDLRMKPFLAIVLPELPPHAILSAHVAQAGRSTSLLLCLASAAIARAKKAFDDLGRLDANLACCRGSEAPWRAGLKDCLRAAVAAGVAVQIVRREVEAGAKGGEAGARLRVEVPETGKGYHDWWCVPKVSSVPS